MATSRELRQRIKSVKNIQHITKAMKMVAAARLRRAQDRALASKAFTSKIRKLLHNILSSNVTIQDPLLELRPVRNRAYYIVGADRGLAGAYSSNVIKASLAEIQKSEDEDVTLHIVSVGRKIKEYFERRFYTLDETFFGFSENPSYEDAVSLIRSMIEKYKSGEYDEINIVYTEFYSALNQKPVIVKIFPMNMEDSEEAKELQSANEDINEQNLYDSDDEFADFNDEYENGEEDDLVQYIFEPPIEETLALLLPKYLETVIFAALIQASASELGSRMAAMTAATDNSSDIIDTLTLNYNKIRQAGITSEITEIVAGAEALQ